MTIRRVVPNLQSDRIDEGKNFYVNILGFEIAMNMGWIVTLVAPENPTAQISLIREDATATVHPNLSVEVADVDAVYANAIAHGLEIVHPLTDEPWGVRRFFLMDPNGVVVNVVGHRAQANAR